MRILLPHCLIEPPQHVIKRVVRHGCVGLVWGLTKMTTCRALSLLKADRQNWPLPGFPLLGCQMPCMPMPDAKSRSQDEKASAYFIIRILPLPEFRGGSKPHPLCLIASVERIVHICCREYLVSDARTSYSQRHFGHRIGTNERPIPPVSRLCVPFLLVLICERKLRYRNKRWRRRQKGVY